MKHVKTYEGFFDFFKKKHKPEPVSLEDIRECLYDITDESRILNACSDFDKINHIVDRFFATDREIFGPKNLEDQHEDFMDDMLGLNDNPYGFHIKRNIISFKISYNNIEISDQEVGEILDNCKHSIESFDCKVDFFTKEFNKRRNITIRIVALGGIKR